MKTLFRPVCWMQTIIDSFMSFVRDPLGFYVISGHEYVEVEQDDPNKSVLECELCGKRSIGYYYLSREEND
jgi:hypothetical protein